MKKKMAEQAKKDAEEEEAEDSGKDTYWLLFLFPFSNFHFFAVCQIFQYFYIAQDNISDCDIPHFTLLVTLQTVGEFSHQVRLFYAGNLLTCTMRNLLLALLWRCTVLDFLVLLVCVGRQGHGCVAGSELIYLFVMLIVFST
jgi:hypothetical protein